MGEPEVRIGACPECGVACTSAVKYCANCGCSLNGLVELGAASAILPAGTIIGSYRVLDLLGEGGMGRVYVAEHVKLGRRVAVKILRAEFSSNPIAISRFFAEARAVNQISHENIVEITDFLESHNCYIMELLRGEDLGLRLLRAEPPSLDVAVEIGMQIASALTAVHAAKIIHRDLKPENIFLIERASSRHFVKLLDFGVAKLVDPSGQGVSMHSTAAGQIIGTPEYMSPEQAGGQVVDHRTDIYALGVILYELVTGVLPFTAKSFGELVIKHMTVAPKRPSLMKPSRAVPPGLDDLIMHLLAKDASERPQSMEDVEQRLQEIHDGMDLPVQPRRGAGTSGSMRAVRLDTPMPRVETGPLKKIASPAGARSTPEGSAESIHASATGPTMDAAPSRAVVIPTIPPEPITLPEASAAIPAPPTTSAQMAAVVELPAARKPPTLAIVAGVAGLAVVALVAWIALHGSDTPVAATAPQPPPPPAQPTAPAVSPKVHVRFNSSPAGAIVRVAGSDRELGVTPFGLVFDRSEQPLRIELEKAGYVTTTEEISLYTDGVLAASLTAVPAPPPADKKPVVAPKQKPKQPPKPLDKSGTMDVFGGK